MSDARLQNLENSIRGGLQSAGDWVDGFINGLFGVKPTPSSGRKPRRPRERRKSHCKPRCDCPHCRDYCHVAVKRR